MRDCKGRQVEGVPNVELDGLIGTNWNRFGEVSPSGTDRLQQKA